MSEDELLTLARAATETGYTPSRLRKLAGDGVLPATLYGKVWLVKRGDLDRFAAEHKPTRGRPRGSRNRPPAQTTEPPA